jgi:hypothetical protein
MSSADVAEKLQGLEIKSAPVVEKPVVAPKPVVKKRGPGRPPKKQYVSTAKKEGVLANPKDPNNHMEFVYINPEMLRTWFMYLKSITVTDFHIRFDPAGLTFFAKGASSRAIGEITGSDLNQYYCEKTFWVGAACSEFNLMLNSIDKSFTKVQITCERDNNKQIFVSFEGEELQIERNYKIMLKTVDDDKTLYALEKMLNEPKLKLMPIRFHLTAKQFKKSITNAIKMGTQLHLEKLGDSHLRIRSGEKNKFSEVYKSPAKVGLVSLVDKNSTFSCSFVGNHIKFITPVPASTLVTIYAAEECGLIIRSKIDILRVSTFIGRG